ncbi:MAG: dihydrodipicolinate synthase family protein, partial [Verrucomicrobiae bacterium]|nr:dihydrodipicolinate synthase family protein [Verrucomicrobiae bacterium]NNJ86849.1 dihydrodipicolinate synthase family protein [Akkermansiaceae bacterium]
MSTPSLPELKPRRRITGMSAILLPFSADGSVDWAGFEGHVERTSSAGLTPAVNMDTGYANLIDEATRIEALQRAQTVLAGRPYIAGAYVGDQPGAAFDMVAYGQQIDQIQAHGGSPIIFQSYGLTGGDVLAAYNEISKACDQFLAFE